MATGPVLPTWLRRVIAVLLAGGVTVAGTACSMGGGSFTPTAPPGPGNPQATTTSRSTASTSSWPPPSTTSPRDGDPAKGDPSKGDLRLTARVDSSGEFDVTEVVRLADPVSSLSLRPPDFTQIDGDLGRAQPVASQLQMTANRRAVKVPGGQIRSSTSLILPAPARLITLRYRLTGVSHRSQPSAPGRALAAIGPLTAGVPDDLPVAVAVPGRTVRNLQCPTLVEQTCATGPAGTLRIRQPLPWHSAIVVVQLDMT